MFFELRTYDLKPGKAPVYLEFFRTAGLGHVTRHLPMVGYWLVESGRLNRIEHLWAYESLEERDACRAGLAGDANWTQGFVPRAFVDVVSQTNRFLTLEQASPAFDAATLARKTHHPHQTADTPMFAPGFHALTIGETPLDGPQIATFRTLSGPRPGQALTLGPGGLNALPQGVPGIETHEILRPLSLSPLR